MSFYLETLMGKEVWVYTVPFTGKDRTVGYIQYRLF